VAVVSVNLFLSSTPELPELLANMASGSSGTALAVAITSALDPINSANAGNLTVSGTGKAGAMVSVVVTDGSATSTARTATVGADGNWTVSGINANQLANGKVTYRATITNSSGATATSTRTATKSATDPLVDIATATNPINLTNQHSVSASGTAQAGSSISVIVTDGTNSTTAATTTTAADGTWSVSGIDARNLKDGSITYRVTMKDSDNRTFTDTFAATKTTVAITSATNPVNAEGAANASVQGTGHVGATISVVVTDGTNTTGARTTTVGANGNWSITGFNLTGLADGPIKYVATANDGAGNSDQSELSATKDAVAPVVNLANVTNPIGLSNYKSTTANGTGEVGATISVVASDGTNSTTVRTATVAASGNWSVSGIDLSALKDGTITYTATATDSAGNTSTDTLTSIKTTVQIDTVTDPINSGNSNNLTVSGTGQAGLTVTVVVTNGSVTSTERTTTVAADGTWSVTGLNANQLANGTVTYRATITDGSGNTATSTRTATKNSTQPLVDITSASNPITITNQNSVTVSGTAQAGSALSVVISDGTNSTTAATTTAAADGTWSVTGINASALKDGPVTYTVTMTDSDDHTFTDTLAATKTTVVITSATNPVNGDNAANATAQGTGQVGATISVVATDGTATTQARTTTVTAGGTWTVSGIDTTGLADGPITYIATATDTSGNTDISELAATKDTVDPALTLTFATDPITLANHFSTTVRGTGEAGVQISVVASDGTNTTSPLTTTVAADGTWSIAGLNLSNLADGTITYTATATDSAGNTTEVSDSATKATLVLNTVTDPINLANYKSTGASGTGQVGATVSVRASDGTNQTDAFTTTVAADGTWSVSGIDLTNLRDGTITYTATANDGSGNTAVRTDTATKATVRVTSVTNPITIDNQTSTTASGTGQVGANISVTATDGTTTTAAVTTTVGASGTWSVTGLDVSGLADGTITFTATADDGAGNTATSTLTSTKALVALITSVTNPITNANQSSTTASGTGKAGATVSVTATDGTTTTTPQATTVSAGGTWSVTGINVSSLLDGTITYTATSNDGLGNTTTSTLTATKSTNAPIANDDTYDLAIGATLTTTTVNGVLSNDSNGAMNATLISGPSHGSMTLNPDGTFTYTQTTYGFDQFTYEVTNASGQTDQATVTIRVPNLPPLPEGAVLTTTASGLQYYDYVVGTGASPNANDTVTVDYVGYLPNGNIFDSNDNVNFPLSNLIVGFSEGVQGMQVGGMRRLIIPPDIGYGPGGNPGAGIGGTDTIVFDVTLDAIV